MPEVEARLHAEIDQVLDGRLPTLADVPKLVYTRAVFEEVLRLYPPVPLLTREAVHDESFSGCRIPKGSLIVVCPWLLHRHRMLWHKPDHFIPERFMPGGIPAAVEIRLHSLQRRSAHLHRHGVRADGSDPVHRHHRAGVHAAPRARPSRRGRLPPHLAAGRELPMRLIPRARVEGGVADDRCDLVPCRRRHRRQQMVRRAVRTRSQRSRPAVND